MRHALLAVLVGIVLGLGASLAAGQAHEGHASPAPAPLADHIPEWLGFFPSYINSRYPLYYCLDNSGAGGAWSQEDRDTAHDVIENAWGWRKINRTVLTQVEERCDEPPRVAVRFVLQTLCDPAVAYACVVFDGWHWTGSYWTFDTATVWVDPGHHAYASHGSRATMFSHEFGHVLGLADQEPARYECGYTLMDYQWEISCGIPPYPTYRDILEVDGIGGSYRDPAWYRCTVTSGCLQIP